MKLHTKPGIHDIMIVLAHDQERSVQISWTQNPKLKIFKYNKNKTNVLCKALGVNKANVYSRA